jgi:hypothetical protein
MVASALPGAFPHSITQKELVSIMDDHGLHAFAKSICDRGRAPCSEAEFTAIPVCPERTSDLGVNEYTL